MRALANHVAGDEDFGNLLRLVGVHAGGGEQRLGELQERCDGISLCCHDFSGRVQTGGAAAREAARRARDRVGILILFTAILLVREMVGGAFLRLKMAGVTGINLIGGITLAQLAICAVQVAITLVAAYACGLQTNGSVLLLGTLALIASLTASGCGLITACFSKSDGEAANFSMIFLVPLVFFSGAMYPLPLMPLFTLFGHTVDFSELLPTTFATDGIRRVMIYGEGLTTVWPDLFWLVAGSLFLFALGIGLFQRIRLDRAS